MVKERIRIINNKLTHYNAEKDYLEDELFSRVSSQVQSDITQHTTWIRESTHEKVKQRHLDKFERVMARNTNKEPDLSGTQLKRWVINLSKYQLTDSQTQVLAKGLNFAVTPDRVPVDDYVVATEQASWSLPNNIKDQFRAEVIGTIKNTKLPKSNLPRNQQYALKCLSKEKSIKILAADKGRATVVMDSTEYEEKMRKMLSDPGTYETLKRDPTRKYKQQMISMLNDLEKRGKITKDQYWYLYPTLEKVPRMYGSPKIHKDGTPLRPMVD